MSRTESYLIIGTGYKDGEEIDLRDRDLVVEVEVEHFEDDPSVGDHAGWEDGKEKATEEARNLLCASDLDDFDFELEKID